MRAIGLACGVLALIQASGAASAQNAAQASELERTFIAYAQGDTDIVLRTLREPADFIRVLPGVLDKKPIEYPIGLTNPWTKTRALFHIEIALAAIRKKWVAGIEPLANSAAWYLIRRAEPPGTDPAADNFERLCHMLILAAYQGAIAPDFIDGYLNNWIVAKARPQDPRFLLARAVAAEQRLLPSSLVRLRVLNEASLMLAGLRPVRGLIRDAVIGFLAAQKNETTEPEASVRMGVLLYRDGQAETALPLLSVGHRVTGDPALRYWGQIFEGRALEQLGRFDEAGRSYVAAQQTSPGAQSAVMALGALTFRESRTSEVAAMLSPVLSSADKAPDPWMIYWLGQQRFLPRWLAEARGASR